MIHVSTESFCLDIFMKLLIWGFMPQGKSNERNTGKVLDYLFVRVGGIDGSARYQSLINSEFQRGICFCVG